MSTFEEEEYFGHVGKHTLTLVKKKRKGDECHISTKYFCTVSCKLACDFFLSFVLENQSYVCH